MKTEGDGTTKAGHDVYSDAIARDERMGVLYEVSTWHLAKRTGCRAECRKCHLGYIYSHSETWTPRTLISPEPTAYSYYRSIILL